MILTITFLSQRHFVEENILSFFFQKLSSQEVFSVGASDQQQGNCEFVITVIPEGIMDVNKDSLHSYSETDETFEISSW